MSEHLLIVMARPQTIHTDTILAAARDEFLAQGFTTATTARIAKRAGVSEGTIFKRFRASLVRSRRARLRCVAARRGRGDACRTSSRMAASRPTR